MPAVQMKYWMLTIPAHHFTPYLPKNVEFIKGQLESGSTTDYIHWQILVSFIKKSTLSVVKSTFGNFHAEPTRSEAADEYVFKDETAIPNTRFELGKKSLKRNSAKDWDVIKSCAMAGNFTDIPADVLIRNYSALKKIHIDNVIPVPVEKEVFVYWGRTGSGKSKRAWEEASFSAYPKSPTSIWWCGYQQHEAVVIDEFRGSFRF